MKQELHRAKEKPAFSVLSKYQIGLIFDTYPLLSGLGSKLFDVVTFPSAHRDTQRAIACCVLLLPLQRSFARGHKRVQLFWLILGWG